MTLRYKNDDHSRQFGTQRKVNVAAARENIGKQYDWLADTDEEVDEQELEAHYSYMAKIQEVPNADSGTDSELVEQVQNDAGYNVFTNNIQHLEQSESVSNTCLVETDDSNVIPDSPDILIPDGEETLALERESQSKLNKDSVHPYDYTKLNSLYEILNPQPRNMYDVILQECVSKDVMCTYLMSLSDLEALDELQCLYLYKVKECDCLAQKLSKQTESVTSNAFRKEREQYFKIQDLKAQLQDKNIAISELKKLIEKGKGKSVDTKFDIASVVRQPNAQRIPKPSVLEGLSKPVTAQTLPQTAKKAIVQLIIFTIDSGCIKHRMGNLKLLCNFVEKFLGTVCFGNDQFAPILGYGYLVQRNDETPEVLKEFLMMIQRNLQAPVIAVRTDRGTKFLNKTLNAFFKEEGNEHQTSTAQTPEQNGVVERQNHGENLDKMKEKGDQCILVGYSTQSKGYCVYNKRTRMIVESIHIRFDEIKEVSETSIANNTSGPVPQQQKATDYDNPDLVPQRQDVYSSADADVPSQK
nr:hypothetical protein [Tanacetum cinerariifolium]